MSKYVRTIYLYLVSLLTLCMLVVGVVGIVNSFVGYLYPQSQMYYYSYNNDYYYDNKSTISPQEKLEDFQNETEINKEKDKKTNLKNTFTFLTMIIVSTPLFAYHFKTATKEFKEEV